MWAAPAPPCLPEVAWALNGPTAPPPTPAVSPGSRKVSLPRCRRVAVAVSHRPYHHHGRAGDGAPLAVGAGSHGPVRRLAACHHQVRRAGGWGHLFPASLTQALPVPSGGVQPDVPAPPPLLSFPGGGGTHGPGSEPSLSLAGWQWRGVLDLTLASRPKGRTKTSASSVIVSSAPPETALNPNCAAPAEKAVARQALRSRAAWPASSH